MVANTRWFRVPKDGDGQTPRTAFYPRYCYDPFQNPAGIRALRHYDSDTTMIVALDIDAETLRAFAAQPGVVEVAEP